ncbi:DUF6807 family protein [Kordiimonas sp.]|uniref:DUF6807 family protein n=1 Tax=Kordiimonas sp. TaxID=1970157 RepID=UPI003A8F953B
MAKRLYSFLLCAAVTSVAACSEAPDTTLSIRNAADHIDVADDTGLMLRYQTSPPDSAEPWRTNYLHPVMAPSGAPVTENAPADHIHHRGIFWSWRGLFISGKGVGDAWVGDHITYIPVSRSTNTLPDGGVELRTTTVWRTDATPTPTDFLHEDTEVHVWPTKDGRSRLHVRVALTALVDGVAIAGSDNEKGYGGMSFRFGRADRMDITSGRKSLQATPAPVITGDEVEFRFRAPPPGWPSAIAVACKVDGAPWHSWILRQELSMQNCAYPGRIPATVSTQRPLILEAAITITQ